MKKRFSTIDVRLTPWGPTSPRRVAALLVASGVLAGAAWAMSAPPRSEYTLTGTVLDFQMAHADFGVTNSGVMGHAARVVSETLGPDGLPQYLGYGREIQSPWYDKDGNSIMPYGDPGLFGGHFDVDVYDQPTKNEIYHEHQFDDKFDVTGVDIAGDPKLLFESIVGSSYPNPLRVVFTNTDFGGGGQYRFDVGSGLITGLNVDGFNYTFNASDLVEFSVNFETLMQMRGTEPKVSQSDVANRDSAFGVKIYDTVTTNLVYEMGVYAHLKDGQDLSNPPPTSPPPMAGSDSCGSPFSDTPGMFGGPHTGAVTSDSTFNQWFESIPGVNTPSSYGITLNRDVTGVYEYTNASFFPVDDTGYGNEGMGHNSNFTYQISASYVYKSCIDQFFEFEANDDVWVYINGKLVVDLGGVGQRSSQYVALDRLGLVDGEPFTFKLFYANRADQPDSNFTMRTNLDLPSIMATLPTSPLYD